MALGFDKDLVFIYHSQSKHDSDAEPLTNVEEDIQRHVHKGQCASEGLDVKVPSAAWMVTVWPDDFHFAGQVLEMGGKAKEMQWG